MKSAAAPLLLALLMFSTGCRTHSVAQPAAPLPASAEFASHGVRLRYAPPWSPADNANYVLMLVDPARPGLTISLDVPKLPPHVPGLIPLGMVVNGYVDDLKKQHPGVAVSDALATRVAGANAKRVRSTWDSQSEEAVLTVHGDRVYILRANSPVADAASATELLDAILGSVKWE